MFDLTRLRLLRELDRRGTMIAVAEACGLTPSAVSQQLATLEREARAPLLERVGRRVRLTSQGARLAAHAETILQAVERAALDLSAERAAARGVLHVAAFATYAKAHLLPAVIACRARHPDLEVVVHDLEPRASIEALRDGRCDLAIGFAYNLAPRPAAADLATTFLVEEPVRLALPPAWAEAPDPLDLATLAGEGWIVGSRQADDHELAQRACALAGFTPRLTHGVDDYDLQLEMIAAGLGVGLAPTLGLRFPAAARVVVRTPAGPPLLRRIEAVTRRALADSPRVQALLAALRDTQADGA